MKIFISFHSKTYFIKNLFEAELNFYSSNIFNEISKLHILAHSILSPLRLCGIDGFQIPIENHDSELLTTPPNTWIEYDIVVFNRWRGRQHTLRDAHVCMCVHRLRRLCSVEWSEHMCCALSHQLHRWCCFTRSHRFQCFIHVELGKIPVTDQCRIVPTGSEYVYDCYSLGILHFIMKRCYWNAMTNFDHCFCFPNRLIWMIIYYFYHLKHKTEQKKLGSNWNKFLN